MKISEEEKSAIGEIVQQKLMENSRRAELSVDGGFVDTQLVYEHVSSSKRVDETLDAVVNDALDHVEEALVLTLSRAMSKVTENTSVDDVKMYAENGRDQLDEVAEEVMGGIKNLLEAYAKVYTAVVCEVANEPLLNDVLDD